MIDPVGAPRSARRRAGKSGWLLGPRPAHLRRVITDAESRELRRAFYEAWSTRASDQGPFAGRWTTPR
jgi:oligopeptidase A